MTLARGGAGFASAAACGGHVVLSAFVAEGEGRSGFEDAQRFSFYYDGFALTILIQSFLRFSSFPFIVLPSLLFSHLRLRARPALRPATWRLVYRFDDAVEGVASPLLLLLLLPRLLRRLWLRTRGIWTEDDARACVQGGWVGVERPRGRVVGGNLCDGGCGGERSLPLANDRF